MNTVAGKNKKLTITAEIMFILAPPWLLTLLHPMYPFFMSLYSCKAGDTQSCNSLLCIVVRNRNARLSMHLDKSFF